MRYIGNKAKLLTEIDRLLTEKKLKCEGLSFCDLFSGTATVANEYNGFYKIIANDIMDYSYMMSSGLLEASDVSFKKLGFDPFEFFRRQNTEHYVFGFCYNNFAPNAGRMYFSDENARYIDFIRDTIDQWFVAKKITKVEKNYLVLCLLEAVSKVANVAGVYSAFLKIWDPRAIKKLDFVPILTKKTKFKNTVFCENANDLIQKISGDILYLDPPYTPTQYCSQYHVLETIARNDNPVTHGVGAHRNNDRLSTWCKRGEVEFWFEKLISEAKFKHIIFSYSDKGIMSLKFIESVLKRYAKPGSYTLKKINFVKYKNTRAVKREKEDQTEHTPHYEYLFYIEKSQDVKYISPLNYIGGKYDTLDLIKSHMPKKIDTFYDLFGGGATVAINSGVKNVVYNDINCFVVGLLEFLATNRPDELYKQIDKYIKKYGLSKGNKEAYFKLREDYNRTQDNVLLYLLICYGFEHQIRFNTKHEFNNPCGNSGFNDEMYEKMISFYLVCQQINIKFECGDYSGFLNHIDENDFVYLDPPYLSNLGVYNDGKRGFNGWDAKQEHGLYDFIEELDNKNIRFMLSNYTEHADNKNDGLILWAKKHGYHVEYDSKITKRNRQYRRELIIFN